MKIQSNLTYNVESYIIYIYIFFFSTPLGKDNLNETFIDLAETYYNAKLSAESAESSLRNELLEPHKIDREVDNASNIILKYFL